VTNRAVRLATGRFLDGLLVAAPLVVLALLGAFVLRDPAAHVTASSAPYTDEAWDLINARNFVLLGRFSTDDWNLHLVNLPYSAVQALVFTVAGVGMAQGRAVSIAAVALTMAALGWGLRRPLGGQAAVLAALAYGTSALVLYYGRLAFLEPMVALGLTIGGLLALRAEAAASGRWGLVAGLALALAVGTKPSAAFAVAGMLVGIAAIGRRSPEVRRWLAGAILTISAAGLAWVVLIGVPNQAAIATDLRIWPAEKILGPLATMIQRILVFPLHNDHFVLLAAPLIVFGVLGWAASVRLRHRLDGASRILLGAATGWAIAGLGILALVPYRPNRYEVPLLPALAILGAIGWAVVRPRLDRNRRLRSNALGVVVAGAVALPGLLLFASWMSTTTSTLPAIQASVRAILPPDAAVQGDLTPAFALQAPVVVLVSHGSTQVNPGDLYVSRGVRWYLGAAGSAPAWATLHAAAWSDRTVRFCAPWAGQNVCLSQLP
jgi:4-amino-4-deoxy-L-arabinose transferase-like glycosyltransferase